MATTLSQMLYELENYEYSREHFEMTKLAREIQLMELYEESQRFINDSIEELREDYSNINESYFFEADEDMDIPATAEKVTKKKNLIVRFFEWIAGLFKKFGVFIKKLWERITGINSSIEKANEKVKAILSMPLSDTAIEDLIKMNDHDAAYYEIVCIINGYDKPKKLGLHAEGIKEILRNFSELLDEKDLDAKCGLNLNNEFMPKFHKEFERYPHIDLSEEEKEGLLIMAIISQLPIFHKIPFKYTQTGDDTGKMVLEVSRLEGIIDAFFDVFNDPIRINGDIFNASFMRISSYFLLDITEDYETILSKIDKLDKFKELTNEQIAAVNVPFVANAHRDLTKAIATTMEMYRIVGPFVIKASSLYMNLTNQLTSKLK